MSFHRFLNLSVLVSLETYGCNQLTHNKYSFFLTGVNTSSSIFVAESEVTEGRIFIFYFCLVSFQSFLEVSKSLHNCWACDLFKVINILDINYGGYCASHVYMTLVEVFFISLWCFF